MLAVIAAAIVVAFLIAVPATWALRAVGRRMSVFDSVGVEGQVKAAARKVPNIGGPAILLGIAAPIGAALALVHFAPDLITRLVPAAAEHLEGVRDQTRAALVFLGALVLLHIVGLIDDRKPMGPWLKLVIMLACAAAVVLGTGSRLLTLLDGHVGGVWLSVLITILWIGVVTNAMNFMDNMDGLSAGVAAIAGACFMAATLTHAQPQWFVASCLALLVGSCLGFLVFNFPRPRATIFMGDGGSLVIGFTLAFLTVRTTYYDATLTGGWYAVLMPLVVLAVPLYDLVSVCVIRMRAGKSPLVGDLNHLSHRFVRRGLSNRAAVLVIYGLTGITALGGVALGTLLPWQAALVGGQTLLVVLVLAMYESRAAEGSR